MVSQPALQRAVPFIHDRYATPLTLDQIAYRKKNMREPFTGEEAGEYPDKEKIFGGYTWCSITLPIIRITALPQ